MGDNSWKWMVIYGDDWENIVGISWERSINRLVYFMENPIIKGDLGVPLFSEISIWFNGNCFFLFLTD